MKRLTVPYEYGDGYRSKCAETCGECDGCYGLDEIVNCDKERANEHFIFGIESVLEYVQNLPAADVAPVVRCKDCLFLESGENECESWEWCKALHREMPPHAFCSLGERKGDSDDEAD